MKISVVVWIILSCLLLLFPLGFLVYYLIAYFKKSKALVAKKIEEIKELDMMRTSILEDSVKENPENFSDTKQEQLVFASQVQVQEDVVVTPQETIKKSIADKQKKLLEKIKYDALVAKEKGKIEEFEKKLIEGLAIDPDNMEFHQLLSDLYFTIGNYKKALSLLKRIVDEDPQDHKAIWQVGEIYLSKGEFQTAELLIEKAIAMKPSNPKYYVSMVEILYNTDRKRDAAEVLEKVSKLRPANVPYLLALADLYAEIEDIDNAKKYYYRVLEYEPSNTKAKQKLQSFS